MNKLKQFYYKHKIAWFSILIFLIMIFAVRAYWSYTGQEIDYRYEGTEYQAGNLEMERQVNIESKGRYTKTLLGKPKKFNGEIIVDNDSFQVENMLFNGTNMAIIGKNSNIYGHLYIDDEFEKMTILLVKFRDDASQGWSNSNGWIISAPSKNRKEAVKLSNRLLQKREGWETMEIE